MNENDIEIFNANKLRVGKYLMIDNRPCEILRIATSKTGKHGSAKAHITARDLFTEKKVETILGTSDKVDVPIVGKETYALLYIDDEEEYVSLADESGKNNRDDVQFPNNSELGERIKNMISQGKDVLVVVITFLDESKIISCMESKEKKY